MVGPGIDRKDSRVGMILILIILLTIILGGIVSSCEPPKQQRYKDNVSYLYSIGDVVYVKPDSTLAAVTDRDGWSGSARYVLMYKNAKGEMARMDLHEPQIYGKK